MEQALPPVLGWWRDFAARYMRQLCLQASGGDVTIPHLDGGELATLVLTAPMMAGAEYLNQDKGLSPWLRRVHMLTYSPDSHGTQNGK